MRTGTKNKRDERIRRNIRIVIINKMTIKKESGWEKLIVTFNFDKFNTIPTSKEIKEAIKTFNSKNLRIISTIYNGSIVLEKHNLTFNKFSKILNKWILKNFDVITPQIKMLK